jgi:hypothetical protein
LQRGLTVRQPTSVILRRSSCATNGQAPLGSRVELGKADVGVAREVRCSASRLEAGRTRRLRAAGPESWHSAGSQAPGRPQKRATLLATGGVQSFALSPARQDQPGCNAPRDLLNPAPTEGCIACAQAHTPASPRLARAERAGSAPNSDGPGDCPAGRPQGRLGATRIHRCVNRIAPHHDAPHRKAENCPIKVIGQTLS